MSAHTIEVLGRLPTVWSVGALSVEGGPDPWAGSGAALLAVALAYLLGSVPFGLVLGWMRGVDVRRVGSGNIGATNVGRALGRPWAVVAFACDFLKGWLPSFWVAPDPGGDWTLAVLCGVAAVCGHVWPLYLRFRGGKGVATGCGAMVAIDPVVFLLAGAVWLAAAALFRYVSLASLAMGVAFPVAAWWRMGEGTHGVEVVLGAGALTALVFLRHRANMARLRAGTEPRLGRRKGDDAPADQPRDR